MTEKVDYGELLPHEFEARLAQRPVGYLPLGTAFLSCHLTRILNSGGNTQFGQDIRLQQVPQSHNYQ